MEKGRSAQLFQRQLQSAVRLHLLAFPLWGLATVHFLTAGTDARTSIARAAVIGSSGLVCALTAVRVDEKLARRERSATLVD